MTPFLVQVFVPVSHCKDTYNFDKTNNFFKKVKEKGDQVSGLLCQKLTELLYKVSQLGVYVPAYYNNYVLILL